MLARIKLLQQANYLGEHENVPTIEIVEVVLVQCNSVEININKSLKHYILLCQINFMLTC